MLIFVKHGNHCIVHTFNQLQLKVNVQIWLHLNLLFREWSVLCKRNFIRLDMSYLHSIIWKVIHLNVQHTNSLGDKCRKKATDTSQGKKEKKKTHCTIFIPKDKHINMKMVKPYKGKKSRKKAEEVINLVSRILLQTIVKIQPTKRKDEKIRSVK